jgi:SSS family solute:Na+ symporter
LIKKDVKEKRLVWIGRSVSSILAIFAILSAPMVAKAPDGLYQLLQQLNGIFFIPIASIMLAGFFMEKISAIGAKSALIFGLIYYIVTTWIIPVDIHFIHNWGIEFVMNVIIMFTVSHFYPRKNFGIRTAPLKMEMVHWKYAKLMSIILVLVTILIYILLGQS